MQMREHRKVKTMSSRDYVAQAVNRLVDRSCKIYLEFCSLLEQMEDRLPLKEKGCLSGFSAAEGLLKMKVYTESLRFNSTSPLAEIGQEICQKSRTCNSTVAARYSWYLDHLKWLGYDEDSRQHQRSVAASADALDKVLRRIEKIGCILQETDKSESVRVCQLRKMLSGDR